MHAVDDAFAQTQPADSMAKAERDQAALFSLAYASEKGFQHAWTRSPGDMKARHRVTVTASQIAPALSPLHDRKDPQPLRPQPAIFFTCRKGHICLRPLA